MDILKREISRKRQQLEEKELLGVRAASMDSRSRPGCGPAGGWRGGGRSDPGWAGEGGAERPRAGFPKPGMSQGGIGQEPAGVWGADTAWLQPRCVPWGFGAGLVYFGHREMGKVSVIFGELRVVSFLPAASFCPYSGTV